VDGPTAVVQCAVSQSSLTAADEQTHLVGIEQTFYEKGVGSSQYVEQAVASATYGKHGRNFKTTKEDGAIEPIALLPIYLPLYQTPPAPYNDMHLG
jgi:hypothetical protein